MSKKWEIHTKEINISGNPSTSLDELNNTLANAEKEGWAELYFEPSEWGIDLIGIRPPDPAEVERKKELRRKQYLKLKQEFES